MNMNRRDFMKATAALGLVACTKPHLLPERLEFYNDAAEYIHNLNVSIDWTDTNGGSGTHKSGGTAFFLDDLCLTAKHCVHLEHIVYRNPFGFAYMPVKDLDVNADIGGMALSIERLGDKEIDSAILKFNGDNYLPSIPYNTNTNIEIGMPVHLAGNPQMNGSVVRSGFVCDLDGYTSSMKGAFGFDIPPIPGSSGSPIFNDNYEVVGVCSANVSNSIGYGTRIGEFLKLMEVNNHGEI